MYEVLLRTCIFRTLYSSDSTGLFRTSPPSQEGKKGGAVVPARKKKHLSYPHTRFLFTAPRLGPPSHPSLVLYPHPHTVRTCRYTVVHDKHVSSITSSPPPDDGTTTRLSELPAILYSVQLYSTIYTHAYIHTERPVTYHPSPVPSLPLPCPPPSGVKFLHPYSVRSIQYTAAASPLPPSLPPFSRRPSDGGSGRGGARGRGRRGARPHSAACMMRSTPK